MLDADAVLRRESRHLVKPSSKKARVRQRLLDAFAQAGHMLMKGSIVAAGEATGDPCEAQRAGLLVLEGWVRRP